jgi:type I restriction enzyme S subunit
MNIDRDGNLDLSDVKFVEGDPAHTLQFGDVLFNNTNSPVLVGKTALYQQPEAFAFSNHMTRLRLPDCIDGAFIARQMHYLWLTGLFRSLCVNHVNQASIPLHTLLNRIDLNLAPFPEQRRIVEKIDELFELIDEGVEALRRVQANLKRYRASVLLSACEGRLVPTEAELAKQDGRTYESGEELLKRILVERRKKWEAETLAKMIAAGKPPKDNKWKAKYVEPLGPKVDELPELPEGWTWATTAQVGEVQLGRQRAPQHHQGDHMRPYLRVANVFDDLIDTSDVMEMNFTPDEFVTYELKYGDILLNEGQSLELVGRAAMYRDEVPGACFQKTLLRFRACGIDRDFALAVFRYYQKSGRFQKMSKWTTSMAHLSAERFIIAPVPIPPLREQHRIAEQVKSRMVASRSAESAITDGFVQASRLRQSLLRSAFSGQLVPQDPNDEPASALLERIAKERAQAEASRNAMKRRVGKEIGRNGKPRANDAAGAAVPRRNARRVKDTDPAGLSANLFSEHGA